MKLLTWWILLGMTALPVSSLAEPPVKLMDQMAYTKVSFDELELADITDADTITWRANAWFGTDLNKAGLKSRRKRNDGETESKEIQLLYSRAISAFWDLQLGYRHDFKPTPEQDWAVVTLQGMAPYFIEVETELFYGSGGQTSLRVRAEYEAALTQRLTLTPEVELTAYGDDDTKRGVESGLSKLETGLRLRYDITRKFAPYIGVTWSSKLGDTNDLAKSADEDTHEMNLVAGFRLWF